MGSLALERDGNDPSIVVISNRSTKNGIEVFNIISDQNQYTGERILGIDVGTQLIKIPLQLHILLMMYL